ncbi:sigma-54 dependent transcriptional regulator [Acinetobacter sp. NIPH 2699]|uniref:sigma-54 interaction domain-containing protein n=1 Tax=Acinetobacter sp. NIPH 2699 TaxID=2923433 RepID=UPI001F4B7CAD|nr:sigma-54 dependent transcriptional regulator [Acinetobacter sp. NIPH 2699]MCH7336280.1 sigma-54 dependent transcriptional regulator [Acinetobacter sp. NIPH 2699]
MSILIHPESRRLSKSERAMAVVYEDSKSRALLHRIEQIAPSEASALIIGETGTGKELVARHIHMLSHRKNAAFIAVNCGALTESLAESELFGHEKGAFTGAIQNKIGWFEAANEGTLFLDEIGDLSPTLQVKLLRVLQEREIYRVGSLKPIKLNIRIIAATNIRLEAAVQAGKFREDLFYRLNVARLHVHRLADRPEDILPLANHFIEEYCNRLGYPYAKLSAIAIQKLLKYNYPGNIRELENAIHHALLVCKDNIIQPTDFCFATLNAQAKERPMHSSHSFDDIAHRYTDHPAISQLPKQHLQQALLKLFESDHHHVDENLDALIEETTIRVAYEYCHRNQMQTAKLLGVSRNVVRARLLKYKLIGDEAIPAFDISL